MNNLIYDLTINDWCLRNIEKDFSDTEYCFNFSKHKLKGFNLDVFVDNETKQPTRYEMWITRFNQVGLDNELDEVYTLGDYKQLAEQLSVVIKTFEKELENVRTILAPYNLKEENRLTYDGDTGLDLRDIEE